MITIQQTVSSSRQIRLSWATGVRRIEFVTCTTLNLFRSGLFIMSVAGLGTLLPRVPIVVVHRC